MEPKDLYTIAELFEKEAQGLERSRDVMNVPMALKRAKMLPAPSSLLAPVLSRAGLNDNTKVEIVLVVDPNGVVSFRTMLNPMDEQKAGVVSQMLGVRFSKVIGDVLKKAKAVVNPNGVQLSWVKMNWKTTV
jgi:hypothetical protein